MEQKAILCDFSNSLSKINAELADGWLVKFMCSESVSPYNDKICIIFERPKSQES